MEQLYVPAGTLAVLTELGLVERARALELAGCVVQLGLRPELDVAQVAARAGRDLAELLTEYWHQTRRFHALRRRGQAAGLECVVVRRRLGSWRQETGRTKRDLTAQLDALERLGPGVTAQLAALLDGSHAEGTEAQLELVVLACTLDPALGGMATPCEQRRVVTLTARYAGWRDRRVRRLAAVEAYADEVWPAPSEAVLARARVARP